MTTNVTAFEDRLASDDRWFVRVNEGARLVGVSPKAIYPGIYAGSLPARKFRGRGWLIRREDLLAWIEAESVPNVAA